MREGREAIAPERDPVDESKISGGSVPLRIAPNARSSRAPGSRTRSCTPGANLKSREMPSRLRSRRPGSRRRSSSPRSHAGPIIGRYGPGRSPEAGGSCGNSRSNNTADGSERSALVAGTSRSLPPTTAPTLTASWSPRSRRRSCSPLPWVRSRWAPSRTRSREPGSETRSRWPRSRTGVRCSPTKPSRWPPEGGPLQGRFARDRSPRAGPDPRRAQPPCVGSTASGNSEHRSNDPPAGIGGAGTAGCSGRGLIPMDRPSCTSCRGPNAVLRRRRRRPRRRLRKELTGRNFPPAGRRRRTRARPRARPRRPRRNRAQPPTPPRRLWPPPRANRSTS